MRFGYWFDYLFTSSVAFGGYRIPLCLSAFAYKTGALHHKDVLRIKCDQGPSIQAQSRYSINTFSPSVNHRQLPSCQAYKMLKLHLKLHSLSLFLALQIPCNKSEKQPSPTLTQGPHCKRVHITPGISYFTWIFGSRILSPPRAYDRFLNISVVLPMMRDELFSFLVESLGALNCCLSFRY